MESSRRVFCGGCVETVLIKYKKSMRMTFKRKSVLLTDFSENYKVFRLLGSS